MRNYFKKFSIMFVMLLAIIGVAIIQSESVANAASVGQILDKAEEGWYRYEEAATEIRYTNNWNSQSDGTKITTGGDYTPFYQLKFYGTQIRIIACYNYDHSSNIQITIDGVAYPYSEYSKTKISRAIMFEKTGLPLGTHTVKVEKTAKDGKYISADAIDIDDFGYLVKDGESITVDNTSMNLQVGDSKQLTATTTPSGTEVEWLSSDSSIATVDSTGKVMGIKEGKSKIIAQIKGSRTKVICDVTVTKDGGGATNPPVDEPTTGDGNIFIEMADGNIKQAQNVDVADFIKWFKNRDLDKNDNPIYKIKNAKGNVEYLVHDKVVAFEIR